MMRRWGMTERDMQHGKMWDGENLDGWLLSEKLDGCRAFWDGAQMWTRAGSIIPLPEWFRAGLPTVALDGEIWAGRGGFLRAVAAVQRGEFDASIRFMVFDTPTAGGWLERMAVAALAVAGSPVAECVEIMASRSHEDVFELRDSIEDGGGEGVMARNPSSTYRAGRTGSLLKLKDQAEWMLVSDMKRRRVTSSRPAMSA